LKASGLLPIRQAGGDMEALKIAQDRREFRGIPFPSMIASLTIAEALEIKTVERTTAKVRPNDH
jgi:hypothetical protein